MSLLILSNEVLLKHIFTFLEIPDLYKLMHSCSRLSILLRDANQLWKKKFQERWPKICLREQKGRVVNWLDRMNLRLRIIRVVKEEVGSMSALCYPESTEIYTPENVVKTLTTGDYPYLVFIDDELTRLKFNPPEELADDLTFTYYARHLYTKVRMCLLEKKWLNFMRQPESKKSLLEGALLVSEWINMDFREIHSSSDSDLMIDWIVDRVKFLLGETRNYSFQGADVQPTEREILTTISRVLFHEEEMKMLLIYVDDEVNGRDHYVACGCFTPGTYSVDLVLVSDARIGHNNIFCVIYQEVAKRMGILCEPVFCYKDHRFYKRVVLRWKEYPEQAEGYTYIDMYRKGVLQRLDASRRLGPVYGYFDDEEYYDVDVDSPVVPAEEVFQEMLRLLLEEDSRLCHLNHGYTKPYIVYPTSSLCRLACAISPSSTKLVKTYATFCEKKHIQFGDAIRLCQERRISCSKLHKLLNEHRNKLAEKVVYNRSPSIKYAIGLVMIYNDDAKSYLRKRACVIISWDMKCKGYYSGMYGKPVANLDQPFYNILLDDRFPEYVPEEKLELHRNPESTSVNNGNLGMHFSKFDGRIYVPNPMSQSRFPDDEAFARSLVGTM
ncbi:F-box only protein 21-like [Daphnia pulex]|uniref:F-box only protein 21-like n=1 Tax=Daphnia pulex TaxID=6669 RepID=UPI001EDCAF4B|nr:F-box only protein 21-like [Daphnia pulex]